MYKNNESGLFNNPTDELKEEKSTLELNVTQIKTDVSTIKTHLLKSKLNPLKHNVNTIKDVNIASNDMIFLTKNIAKSSNKAIDTALKIVNKNDGIIRLNKFKTKDVNLDKRIVDNKKGDATNQDGNKSIDELVKLNKTLDKQVEITKIASNKQQEITKQLNNSIKKEKVSTYKTNKAKDIDKSKKTTEKHTDLDKINAILDDNGKYRDEKTGRFLSKKELKELGLVAEDEKKQTSRILDMLDGLKPSVDVDVERVDPILDGIKEVADTSKGVYTSIKSLGSSFLNVTKLIGSGFKFAFKPFGKAFGFIASGILKTNKNDNRFFRLFKRNEKIKAKGQKETNEQLDDLNNKDFGGGKEGSSGWLKWLLVGILGIISYFKTKLAGILTPIISNAFNKIMALVSTIFGAKGLKGLLNKVNPFKKNKAKTTANNKQASSSNKKTNAKKHTTTANKTKTSTDKATNKTKNTTKGRFKKAGSVIGKKAKKIIGENGVDYAKNLTKKTGNGIKNVAKGIGGKGFNLAKGVGKGALAVGKRLPVIGSLVTLGTVANAITTEDVKDENGVSEKSKAIAGAVGAGIGGVVGAIGGPIGVAVGSVAGEWLGSKVPTLIKDVDFSGVKEFGKDVSDTITSAFASGFGSLKNMLGFSDNGGLNLNETQNIDGAKGKINGLTAEQTQAYLTRLSIRESSGNFKKENKWGYMGGYQFGASGLLDVGLIKKDKYNEYAKKYGKGFTNGSNITAHKEFLANKDNWKDGYSKEIFLNNPNLQHQSAIKLANNNLKYYKSQTGKDLTNQGDIGGYITASHLKGAGSAYKLLTKGVESFDGLGTSNKKYFDMGKHAVTNTQETIGKYKNKTQIADLSQLTNSKVENITNSQQKDTVSSKNTNSFYYGMQYKQEKSNVNPTYIYNPSAYAKQSIKESTTKHQIQNKTIIEQIKTQNNSNNKDEKITSKQANIDLSNYLNQDVSNRNIAHIVTGGIGGARGEYVG